MMKQVNAAIFQLNRNVWLLTHNGNQVTCPFCRTKLDALMPLGKKYLVPPRMIIHEDRENCFCPRCRSVDRERHIWLYLKEKNLLNFSSKKTMLHVAPEPNLRKNFSANQNINYVSGDLVPKHTKAKFKIDITKIDFDDNHFDFIICNHVLEHIIDDLKAMKELFRVLKPGG